MHTPCRIPLFCLTTVLLLAGCYQAPIAALPVLPTAPAVSAFAPTVAGNATAQPTPAPGASAPVTGGIPLKDALPLLSPPDVWQNFYNITQVPRPSGHLDQIRSFLVNFGKGLNLDTTVDQAGNVLIHKPASKGMENRPGVVLQAHMDMVAQGRPGKDFDPLTDPIQAYVAGDWVHADDTTLGADDGMGLAIIMALLQRRDLAAPAIEALFTVDEETSMSGINGLGTGELHGSNYVNLDQHEEGHFVIGSAGGLTAQSSLAYQAVPLGTGTFAAYTVTVTGLTGGHSAMDIDKGRGHAVKLLVRLLSPAGEQFGLRLASLQGGTAKNAIPVEANALVVLYSAQVPPFTAYLKDFEATVRKELAATEPNLAVKWVTATLPSQVMSLAGQEKVLDALYANPQGVLRMSDTVSGLVETSNNLGVVTAQNGHVQATSMSRSAVDSALLDAGAMVTSVWDLAGGQSAITGHTSPWTLNPDSALLGLFMDTYRQLYGVDANYTAIHAGLECGAVSGMYPQMDIIALGETVADAHALTERVQVSTVPRVVDVLAAVLGQIPAQ